MSRVKVKDLKDGDLIARQTFFVSDIVLADTKKGTQYARLKASDATGTVSAVCWDYGDFSQPAKDLLNKGGLIDLVGTMKSYNKSPQMTITGIGPATTTDLSEFEKISKYDPDMMHRNFVGFIESYETPLFTQLAFKIHDKYKDLFHTRPAAVKMHHAFKHGLLEHTEQMLRTADKLFELSFYADNLNKDLCMFGIMFHDYAKIFEYGDGPGFSKTISGIKVGHIPKMAAIIYHEATLLEIPDVIIDELMSIVLTHHGLVAWGAPDTPSSPEAQFVHYIDNLHGSVFGAIQKIESESGVEGTVRWGHNDQSCTMPKKRFSQLIKEVTHVREGQNDSTENINGIAGEEASLDGF